MEVWKDWKIVWNQLNFWCLLHSGDAVSLLTLWTIWGWYLYVTAHTGKDVQTAWLARHRSRITHSLHGRCPSKHFILSGLLWAYNMRDRSKENSNIPIATWYVWHLSSIKPWSRCHCKDIHLGCLQQVSCWIALPLASDRGLALHYGSPCSHN